ncbi:hypothetical protein L6452_22121 [Arctium lappa]|uniref:Uncharacterized protein n=1 Tax=Arctium lappa TaxID=4217 RepID=A0ACB9B065_ARCLA|nr:hypothetical protein L6452_22121 [Arctium lappa]
MMASMNLEEGCLHKKPKCGNISSESAPTHFSCFLGTCLLFFSLQDSLQQSISKPQLIFEAAYKLQML